MKCILIIALLLNASCGMMQCMNNNQILDTQVNQDLERNQERAPLIPKNNEKSCMEKASNWAVKGMIVGGIVLSVTLIGITLYDILDGMPTGRSSTKE